MSTIRKVKIVGLIFMLSFMIAVTLWTQKASAVPLTLTQSDIDSFVSIASTGGATNIYPSGVGQPWTEFSHSFSSKTTTNYVKVGNESLNVSISGYSEFALELANINEKSWWFDLTVWDVNGNSASGSIDLVNDAPPLVLSDFQVLSFGISGLDSNIKKVHVTVRDPHSSTGSLADGAAEFAIRPDPVSVPEPTSLLLLGSGLLGIGILGRKAMGKGTGRN